MTEQEKREKVINGLTCHVHGDPHTRCHKCPYWGTGPHGLSQCSLLFADALDILNIMLKAQKEATIEPKRIDLEEETKAWLDKMDAVDALGNIANICIDWDGYRTANGLGELINEIWAYARYCADRLAKAQESRVMALEDMWTLKFNDTVIIEQKIPPLVIPTIVRDNIKHDHRLEVLQVVTASTDGTANADYDYYGKTWRCWTSRPTDAQREATPWP